MIVRFAGIDEIVQVIGVISQYYRIVSIVFLVFRGSYLILYSKRSDVVYMCYFCFCLVLCNLNEKR